MAKPFGLVGTWNQGQTDGDSTPIRLTATGATVVGVVEAQTQAKKVRVFKTKRRKQYKKTQGHRTQQTRVKVTSINA